MPASFIFGLSVILISHLLVTFYNLSSLSFHGYGTYSPSFYLLFYGKFFLFLVFIFYISKLLRNKKNSPLIKTLYHLCFFLMGISIYRALGTLTSLILMLAIHNVFPQYLKFLDDKLYISLIVYTIFLLFTPLIYIIARDLQVKSPKITAIGFYCAYIFVTHDIFIYFPFMAPVILTITF